MGLAIGNKSAAGFTKSENNCVDEDQNPTFILENSDIWSASALTNAP